MLNRLSLLAVAAMAHAVLAVPALAWGKIGHRVTGAIAQEHLSVEARAQIALILGVEDLAESSTWADFMRASHEEFWQRTATPWHYVTIPAGKTYADVGAPQEGDAITALAGFRRTLEDPNASRDDKQLALRFTVHVIGDLHQPLHAGNGTDRGGNDVKVTFFGRLTNLHAVWDSDLVEDQQLSYSELTRWLLRRMTPAQVAALGQTDPVVWVTESARLRDGIYPDPEQDLRWGYIFAHRDTVNTRLSHAGVRIAAYLNEVFAGSPAQAD